MILYYLDGCGHCAKNRPAWDDAKKKMEGKVDIKEIEATQAPSNIRSFPTMVVLGVDGTETASISGAKTSGKEILKGLKLRNEGGSRVRRRHTRGRATRGRNRKVRHRTQRNYVALI